MNDNLKYLNQAKKTDIKLAVREILETQIGKTREELPFSLKVADMAKLTGYSENSIYLLLEAGEIPGAKKIKGWRVSRDVFLSWWYSSEKNQEIGWKENNNYGN
jgi:predicted DNA-binding transcriptional regulator AlpA